MSGVFSLQGPRKSMEDAYAMQRDIVPGLDYYAIFDGHGSDDVAMHCAEYMHQYMQEFAKASSVDKGLDVNGMLNFSFQKADYIVRKVTHTGKKAGATATVMLVSDKTIWIANAGDSRAVMCNSAGGCVQLTTDHRLNVPSERKRIESKNGMIVPYGNSLYVDGVLNVTRSIGDDHVTERGVIAQPEIITVAKRDAEFIVLATDGVFDVMSNERVIEIGTRCMEKTLERAPHAEHANIATIMSKVIARASSENRSSPDNVTVMCVVFG